MKPTAPKRIEDYRTTKERRKNLMAAILFGWMIIASCLFAGYKMGIFK